MLGIEIQSNVYDTFIFIIGKLENTKRYLYRYLND